MDDDRLRLGGDRDGVRAGEHEHVTRQRIGRPPAPRGGLRR